MRRLLSGKMVSGQGRGKGMKVKEDRMGRREEGGGAGWGSL